MTFVEAVKSGWANWKDFQGRSTRSEFWWWTLFAVIVGVIAGILNTIVFGAAEVVQHLDGTISMKGGGMWFSLIAVLALLIPNIAVSVRRLHDVDKSGWWLLITLVPVVGLIFIVWALTAGTPGENRFGPAKTVG